MMMEEPSKPGKKKKIEDYEVDSAVDCLIRAEEIKENEELMKLVNKKIAKKKSAINSIADLKEAYAESEEEDEE